MNLNDLRNAAYTKQKNNTSKKSSSSENPVVKPFMPVKFSSAEMAENNRAVTEYENKKNNKEFSQLDSSKDSNVEPIYKVTVPDNNDKLNSATNYLKNGGLIKVPVEEQKQDGSDSVYRRVAKFLIIIGENEAAKILPHLTEAQIEKIVPEIASIRTIDKDEAQEILAEFEGLLNKARQSGGVETAREILSKAYGKNKADEMIKKTMPMEGRRPFDYFEDAESERIYHLLKDENPGIQSMILSHLDPKKAASIINLMNPDEKKEIVMRLAKMEPVSPEMIRRIDSAMHEKSLRQTTEKAENIDGKNALVQILKKMDISSETEILTNLAEENPDLEQDLRSRLFTIDDVVNADDRFIQEKLREMSEIDIAYLVAGKNDDFRDKILDNISSGRRNEVLEQEDILKPMRRSDCEKVTADFFAILRRAYENGHLIIKNRNDDIYV